MKNPFGCDTMTQKQAPKLECESKSSLISTTNDKFVKGPTDCDYCGELFSGPKERRNFYKEIIVEKTKYHRTQKIRCLFCQIHRGLQIKNFFKNCDII